jgi:hypothetical protein
MSIWTCASQTYIGDGTPTMYYELTQLLFFLKTFSSTLAASTTGIKRHFFLLATVLNHGYCYLEKFSSTYSSSKLRSPNISF